MPGARMPGARMPGARMPGARMPGARMQGRSRGKVQTLHRRPSFSDAEQRGPQHMRIEGTEGHVVREEKEARCKTMQKC